MDRDQARALLSRHEGRIPHCYADSLGYLTIGVGHLVDKRRGGRLPEHIIDALLDYDIDSKWHELTEALPWVKDLDEVRQHVMLDMAFNLGVGGDGRGLLGFHNTLRYVKEGNYQQAAANMLLSKWARQVKTRAVRLAKMMETGQWPG